MENASALAGYKKYPSPLSARGYNKNQEEELIMKNLCSNPIHVFQLMLSAQIFVRDIQPRLDKNLDDLKNLVKMMNYTQWPDEFDLNEAIQGLLRAQHTYQLPITDLANE